jgi:predicted hotdog family 3-hydroxylacyl-ACP dehydratase
MVLLDEVTAYDGERVRCRVHIRPDGLFVEGGRVPGVVALEYMAQAIGAYAGLRARAAGQPVRIGYLLGTREMTLEVAHFEVGDELEVVAEHLFGDEQLGSFRCAVSRGGAPVAAATLNVYQAAGTEELPWS